MRKIAAVVLGLAVASLRADTIIDFNAAHGTGANAAQSASRTFSVTTTSQALLEFDTSTPIWPANGEPPLYGGLNVTNGASGGTMGTTSATAQGYYRFHDNDPVAWPSNPKVLALTSASGDSYNNVTMAMVFKKGDFENHSDKTVVFEPASTLSLHITDWFQQTGGQTVEIRFLVLEDSQYYVSEAVRTTAGAGTLSLTDFNNNATVGRRWAPISLSATAFGIPNSLTFGAVDFNDVQQVGFIAEGSRKYSSSPWGFDTFLVTASPAPPSGTLIAIK